MSGLGTPLAVLQRLHDRGENLCETIKVFGEPLEQFFPFRPVREIAISANVNFAAFRILWIVPRQRQIDGVLKFLLHGLHRRKLLFGVRRIQIQFNKRFRCPVVRF